PDCEDQPVFWSFLPSCRGHTTQELRTAVQSLSPAAGDVAQGCVRKRVDSCAQSGCSIRSRVNGFMSVPERPRTNSASQNALIAFKAISSLECSDGALKSLNSDL